MCDSAEVELFILCPASVVWNICWLSLHLLFESVEIPLVSCTRSPTRALWSEDLDQSSCISWRGELNSLCELVVGCVVEQPACQVLADSSSLCKEAGRSTFGPLPETGPIICKRAEVSGF